MTSDQATAATAEGLAILRSGKPNAGALGSARLREAVSLGSGEAAAALAYFAAAGLGQKANWDEALELLQRGAELGWAPALAELRVLAGFASEAPCALRSAIDIVANIGARAPQLLSSAPRIGAVSNFMSTQECAWLIELSRARLAPAAIYARDREGEEIASVRTNSSAGFSLLDMNVVLTVLRRRIANTIEMSAQNLESPTVLHYTPGQEFKPHYDFLDVRFPGPAAELRAGGQRIMTFLVYLNEDFEGGETAFPEIDYRFKGKTGDAIVFGNIDAQSRPDRKSKHAGLAPLSGEKWVLSQWVRDRAQM